MRSPTASSSSFPPTSSIKLLLIEACEADRRTYRQYLQSHRDRTYDVIEANSLVSALEMWQAHQPDVVVLAWNFPDGNSLEFLQRLEGHPVQNPLPVIMLTDPKDEPGIIQAMQLGIADYLIKTDLTQTAFVTSVQQVYHRFALARRLQRFQQQQAIIANIALRVRQSLQLQEMLEAIVLEVRQFLHTDRVIIYQFNPDWSGTVVAESVVPPWLPSLQQQVADTCFQDPIVGLSYREGKMFVANDIYDADLTPCHLQLLEQFQVRANLVVPILLPEDDPSSLWGLLVAHECTAARIWEDSDLNLVQQLSVQLAIAIQQATLYQNLQTLNASLEQQVEERTQALATSERLFRDIFNHSFQLLGILDLQGHLLEVNQAALAMKGLSWEAVANCPFWETPWWDISTTLRQQIRSAIVQASQGEPFRQEIEVLNRDRQVIAVDFSLRPLLDASGAVRLLIAEGQDLSQAKRTEATLRLQAQTLDQISDAVISTDGMGTICSWNQSAETLYGYTASEAIGQNVEFLYDDPEDVRTQVLGPLLANGSHEAEVRVRTQSGELRYVSVRLTAVLDDHGHLVRLLGCANDITDRKQSEVLLRNSQESLRRSEEFHRLAIEASGIGTWDLVLPANTCFISPQMARLMDYPDTQTTVPASQWQESIHPDDRAKMTIALNATIEQDLPFQVDFRIQLQDGSIRWLSSRGSLSCNATGDPVRIRGVSVDITDRKAAEAVQQEAEQKLQQLNQELEAQVARRTAELQALSERLKLALTSGAVGCWDWDITSDIAFWDDRMYEMYGIDQAATTELPYQIWVSCLHPDDRAATVEMLNQALRGNAVYNPQFRVVLPDRTIRYVQAYGTVLRNAEGIPQKMIGLNLDITAQKQAEAENLQLKERLQFLLSASPAIIFTLQPGGAQTVTLVNDNLREILGYEPDALMVEAKVWKRYLHPEDATRLAADLEQLWDSNSHVLEYRFRHRAGHYLWFQLGLRLVRDAQGEPIEIVGYAVDVSDRKQVEIALAESQHFIQQIADTSPHILYLYDIQEHRNIYVNREVASTLGYSPAAITAMGDQLLPQLLHPEDQDYILHHLQQMQFIQDNEVRTTEYRLRHVNGDWRWFYTRDAVFLRDSEGLVKVIIGSAQDITDRKQAELELRKSEEFRRRLIESSSDCIKVISLEGELIYLNAGGVCLLELDSAEDVLGQDWMSLWPQDFRPYVERAMIAGRSGDAFRFQGFCPTAKGTPKWWDVVVTPVLDEDGQPCQVLSVSRDVTERKTAEEQLQRANEQLQMTNAELDRATRHKDEFLANMSHELRTPLNAVLGMTEGLQDEIFGPVNEKQIRALRTIEHSGVHLLDLINDILDVAKIESGQMTIDRQPASIHSLCQSSLTFVKQQALKKEIQLVLHCPKDLPQIWLDERRILQALINLLTNAVKFTLPGGCVTLEVTCPVIDFDPHLRLDESLEINDSSLNANVDINANVDVNLNVNVNDGSVNNATVNDETVNDETAPRSLKIAVIDTGIGITKADIAKLFQPFVQVDSALNRQQTGTGLGLALVKRIVELHGGTVRLTSEVGVGSCFAIELPYTPTATEEELSSDAAREASNRQRSRSVSGATPDTQQEKRILLWSKAHGPESTIVNYLEAKGYRVFWCQTQQAAIAQAQHSPPALLVVALKQLEELTIAGQASAPVSTAIPFIRQIAEFADLPIVVLGQPTAIENAAEDGVPQDDRGVVEYLPASPRPQDLAQLLHTLLR
ncbi:PAS domain S-box protein [Alkalinema sp. FACHB-956]|uniref:PAS domain S-box protein n=1 Tax=Alkalinema sp. FACHB-956 TaxID=2692768 RepID=UPI001686373C|nr:PAS domain S-box protein [Alkalinema sp. FACHB-956]MBD2327239.1 PAS domain S-box protein [Alkalinema sp. FACHB-956]